jgi:hypothetical protein
MVRFVKEEAEERLVRGVGTAFILENLSSLGAGMLASADCPVSGQGHTPCPAVANSVRGWKTPCMFTLGAESALSRRRESQDRQLQPPR